LTHSNPFVVKGFLLAPITERLSPSPPVKMVQITAGAVLRVVAQILFAVGAVAQFPMDYAARWRAEGVQSAQIVSGEVTGWNSDKGGFRATPPASSLRPQLNTNSLFCKPSLHFQGGRMVYTPSIGSLDPGSGGFAVFVVSRQTSYAQWGTPVWKGTPYQSWSLNHGAGGGFSMAYIYRGGETQNANSHTTFTSTTTWNTWLLSIEVSGATKSVKGYRDHNRNGWFDGGLNSYRNTYTGSIGSVTPLFIGSSPSFQYAGDIADIIIYPRQLSPTEIDDVFTAMDTTYYLTCPALSAVNGTNGDVAAGKAFCSGVDARMGNECQQACNTGLVRTYGTLNHMCQVGEWTGSNLVCERECPPLSPPLYFSTCARTMLAKASWISDAADLDVGLWALSPPVPRSERPNYWTVNPATGLLMTAAGTAPCAVGSPSLLYMMTPRWADLVLATMRTMVSVVVTPTSGVLGVAFRAADSSNYYLLQLGVAPAAGGAGWAALTRYKTGLTPLTFANVSVPFYSAGRAVPVNVSMQGVAFDVTLGGATVIAGAINGDLSYGGIGLYSAGVGAFGALSVTTECDSGGSCTLATPGSSCVFTCATGYVLVAGSASRTCSAMADGSSIWSGQSAVCSLTPPTFANTSAPLLVAENSPQDTSVGQPIVAVTSAARVSIIYSILAEYPPPLDPMLPRFGIGACSGQVFVLSTNSTLDYETQVSGRLRQAAGGAGAASYV
jgi:hypothetical protein